MSILASKITINVSFSSAVTTKNISSLRITSSLWGESTDDRWIFPTKVQWGVSRCHDTVIRMIKSWRSIVISTCTWWNLNPQNTSKCDKYMRQYVSSPLTTWWRYLMETFSALLHKRQWHGAFMFSLICVRINGWVNNCEAGDLRRYRAHYDVTIMTINGLSTVRI